LIGLLGHRAMKRRPAVCGDGGVRRPAPSSRETRAEQRCQETRAEQRATLTDGSKWVRTRESSLQ